MTKATGRPRGRPRKYRFDLLDVGEAMLVRLKHMGQRVSVSSAANAYGRKYGVKLTTKLVSLHGAAHLRVTRIA